MELIFYIKKKYFYNVTSPYEKLIIKRIQQYLKKEKLKQKELANKLNWSPTKLNDILKKRHPIGKNSLHDIKKLGISIEIEDKAISNFNENQIEIAEITKGLTEDQFEALKTIIHGLAKEKSKAA